MYRTLDAPLSAHVELTTSCNQRCRHCYNFWRSSSPELDTRLTPALAAEIARQLSGHRVFHVILTGGEPLMNQEGLFVFIPMLRAAGISFSLNSNLALLTPSVARQLKEHGLHTVLTSLLSNNPTTHNFLAGSAGSFRRTVQGIQAARSEGLGVAVNMVVSKYNLLHVEDTGRLAYSLGASAFSATRVMPPHHLCGEADPNFILNSEEVRFLLKSLLKLKYSGLQLDSLVPYPVCFFETEEEYNLLGQRTCSAGKTSVAIGADGSVRACPHHEVVYGSLATEELGSVWMKMSEWRDGSLVPSACKACRLLPKYGGGCRMSSKDGSVCEPDSIMQEDRVQSLPSFSRAVGSVDLNNQTRMRVRRPCRFRADKAVGIVNTGGIKNTFVQPDTLDVLLSLHETGEAFTPETLRASRGIKMPEDAYLAFLANLVQREVAEIL